MGGWVVGGYKTGMGGGGQGKFRVVKGCGIGFEVALK